MVVMAVFFGAGLLLRHYSHLEVPERFTLRHPPQGGGPMTMLAVMAAGGGIGLGVFLAFRAIHPRPIPLAVLSPIWSGHVLRCRT